MFILTELQIESTLHCGLDVLSSADVHRVLAASLYVDVRRARSIHLAANASELLLLTALLCFLPPQLDVRRCKLEHASERCKAIGVGSSQITKKGSMV